MNEKLGDIGNIGDVTVEQVEKALFDVFQEASLPTVKIEAAKVLLEHFDRKARLTDD